MGSMFKPKVQEVKPQAPNVDIPTPEPVEPELGPQETDAEGGKKKKGKSALKIDLRASGGSGSGANIV